MIKTSYILLLLTMVICSCEKVIDIDLNVAHPQVVIEGKICNAENESSVRVTWSGSYFNELTDNSVMGAVVVLEDERGFKNVLSEGENGIYRMNEFVPMMNHEYTLSVEIDGINYQASSLMYPPVKIDSIGVVHRKESFLFKEGYYVTCNFTDPVSYANYYRIKVLVNGEFINTSDNNYIIKDKLFNGKSIKVSLRRKLFDIGDKVTIELQSIDEKNYEYFTTLQEITGGNSANSAAPSNPVSNFTNGALGYFSAYSFDSHSLIIHE